MTPFWLLAYKLSQTTTSGDNRLGNDPRLYAAMEDVELLLCGVHAHMTGTAADASIFTWGPNSSKGRE